MPIADFDFATAMLLTLASADSWAVAASAHPSGHRRSTGDAVEGDRRASSARQPISQELWWDGWALATLNAARSNGGVCRQATRPGKLSVTRSVIRSVVRSAARSAHRDIAAADRRDFCAFLQSHVDEDVTDEKAQADESRAEFPGDRPA